MSDEEDQATRDVQNALMSGWDETPMGTLRDGNVITLDSPGRTMIITVEVE